ncbi:MAG: amino acid permease [Candidatus Micrarchaeota archaeon]|nr:amino acid permease [Candidatus Micrarchaeota archaeon]
MADKSISVKVATAVGLGAIIGAGIFVLSGTAIALAGPLALIAFIAVGIVALLVALHLGELGTIMPNLKGASYSYVYKAFGSELGFITGMLLYFSYATAISVVATGFGSYLSSILGMSEALYTIPFAILLIFALAIVNILGIKKAANADFVLVIIKILILVVFIAFAFFVAFYKGGGFPSSHFALNPATSGLGSLFAASVVIFFAYTGFQAISTFTGRIRGGAVWAARSIVISVVISMILYTLVAFSLMLLVPASSFTVSGDPLSFALKAVNAPQWLFLLVGIGALIATTSATLAMMLGSSRTLYQISSDRLLPKVLRRYNQKRDVAINGVIISAVIAVIMLFSGDIFTIAAISNFGLLFSFLVTSFAVIHYRRLKTKTGFKIPFYPYLTVITIIAVLALMIGMPQIALLIGVLLTLSLIVIYYSLREMEGKKVIRVQLFK